MKHLLLVAMATLFSVSSIYATIVVPFDNLGHLSENCDEIVVAKVISFTDPSLSDDPTHLSWNIEITTSFKGLLTSKTIIPIDGQSSASKTMRSKIHGDINLEVGETYLFFLDQNEYGVWKPQTLSYYVYQEMSENGRQYFVPVKESLDIHLEGNTDMLFVIDSKEFNNQLNQHVNDQFIYEWLDAKITSNKTIEYFYPSVESPPMHCGLATNDGFRWNIWDGASPGVINVYCDTPNDLNLPGSNGHAEVQNSITELEGSYGGIDLLDAGSTNFVPTCLTDPPPPDSPAATSVHGSSNFLSFTNTLNGGDNILVVFDDPCNQIPDLAGCSGTLAQGGSYAYGPSYVYDGQNWFTSGNGFCVVNNNIASSTGTSCNTAAEYRLVLTHEISHALSLNHIPSANGAANMNPFCCSGITALDIQCVDYMYSAVVPVTLSSFTASNKTGYNVLNWTTETEANSETFEIQRSSDGKSFVSIANKEAAGYSNTVKEYTYTDLSAPRGKVYYRLKQIDYNGDFDFSNTVSLGESNDAKQFSFSPNPAYNTLNLEHYQGGQIQVLSPLGKEMIHVAATSSLDISGLPVGVYFLNFVQGTETFTQSFIKL